MIHVLRNYGNAILIGKVTFLIQLIWIDTIDFMPGFKYPSNNVLK